MRDYVQFWNGKTPPSSVPVSEMPEACPKHPDGLIEHQYDLTQCVLNGLPAGEGVKSNHRYFCHDCGLELCGINESVRRIDATERLRKDTDRALALVTNGWTK